MPLSDNSKFGVKPLTQAINRVAAQPTQIRDLGIFKPEYLSTTYVDIENQDGQLTLVQSKERGQPGAPVEDKVRAIRTFRVPHLPIDDVVRADDVQNVRAFGGGTQAETVQEKVNDKLADGKAKLEMTREHLMLGALQGKILDADGTELYDIYKEFGLKRQTHDWKLDTKTTEVGLEMDKTLSAQRKLLKGAMVSGWVALCGEDFLMALKYHDKIKPLYERFRDGAAYREGKGLNPIEFEHNGIRFIHYTGDFGASGAKIKPEEAILLPLGAGKLYAEYFAPGDMNETVNTKALPYYATREKLDHDVGWSLRMQSNPLPLVLRPELVCTLTV